MAIARSETEAAARFLASPLSAAVAEFLTLPLDLVKTRLQVETTRTGGKRSSLLSTLARTCQTEGYGALWKGLAPALLRQVSYTTLSMVLYDPMKQRVAEYWSRIWGRDAASEVSYPVRLLSGGLAGAAAILVFNWTEVIKVQIQASKKPIGVVEVVRRIYASRGVLGFWTGASPNIIRTFVVNAAELGSYDQLKSQIFVPLVGNSVFAHLGASGLAGVISALVSTPVDVIKTRWMNSASQSPNTRIGIFKTSMLIFREEGIGALYAGFAPICFRKVIWCAAFFCSYESLLPIASITTSSQH